MEKPYKGPWVMRTLLFVPGHSKKKLKKATQLNADCIALCLEDAVPLEEKENARQTVRKSLKQGFFSEKPIFVRINSLDSGLMLPDLEAVACRELDGFIYPMTYTPDDIKNFDAHLCLMEDQLQLKTGHFSIVALIETPLAVLNAFEIAKASDRVVALLFGCEDYMAEMESRYSENEQSLFVPRSMVAMASHAAGVEAIDTPYVRINDLDGLKRFAALGRDLGMTGMVVMTPHQVPVARACYTPNSEEVAYALDVINAAEAAREDGKGIVYVRGKFISPPTVKQSQRLLARLEAIKNFEDCGGRT